MTSDTQPNLQAGIDFWQKQPASLDGVLGGFGSGPLPRVDALGSRQFLLGILPELSTIPSTLRHPRMQPVPQRRYRALDVGAGIGRVTVDVLLRLVSDVVLLEPVESFITEALEQCKNSVLLGTSHNDSGYAVGWPGIADGGKSVTFVKAPLQNFDPARPKNNTEILGRVGFTPIEDDTDSGFDIIWCQWCLGHLNDSDLTEFLRMSKKALRDPRSLIVVKENLCTEPDGRPRAVFDEEDSSLTRSDLAFKKIFKEAGLKVFREKVQRGLPQGLYAVKMYALRAS
ncbi:alpha-N-methyltransferase NTM1 [Pisolithus croceorrhizus]|nr:alpha-N-methyltransferase NTM1 [Pisolithus croceorrhizus]KAI6132216.1 alpha-N-methyltransferase NTM1 [Pisolithus croceorrhizus]KAI6160060.1 alpha-N-methyltransferase NTM1 [Pisolithus thermaeus]